MNFKNDFKELTVSTTMIALSIAAILVAGLVVTLVVLSLVVGGVEQYFGRPKMTFLRSTIGDTGFAFDFSWNEAKEPAQYDTLKMRLFNPFGNPTHLEVAKSFDKKKESFAEDVDLGKAYHSFISAKGFENADVQVELAAKDGVNFIETMKGKDFLAQIEKAVDTVESLIEEEDQVTIGPDPKKFGIINRDTIADTVPGKGPMVAVPTNPAFAQFFGSPSGKADGGAAAEAQENFSVAKVWIEDGCIVCNACEDIYPEVFEVIADGCLVRPGFPTDDGLKVQEAAEACPVEVIKFQTA